MLPEPPLIRNEAECHGGRETLRVMTYNVHSCRGLDLRVRPERIARVIEEYAPDLVALQELDVNRRWSGRADQPRVIAESLRMHCHFQPTVMLEGEHYGIAVLSRYPIEVEKAGRLISHGTPRFFSRRLASWLNPFFEPREAILCRVRAPGGGLYFMNTHLSLRPNERMAQAESLFGPDWMGSLSEPSLPFIFCGDFNAGPRSEAHALFAREFRDVRHAMNDGLRKTFFSFSPIVQVDHIFFKGGVRLAGARIPSTPLTRSASDHLPVIADFTFNGTS